MRSVVDHLYNITGRRRGEKKMKQTRGRCRYTEMYKGEKGETKMVGRITRIGGNDTLKSRETPKPSLLLSAEILSRPSKCIV